MIIDIAAGGVPHFERIGKHALHDPPRLAAHMKNIRFSL